MDLKFVTVFLTKAYGQINFIPDDFSPADIFKRRVQRFSSHRQYTVRAGECLKIRKDFFALISPEPDVLHLNERTVRLDLSDEFIKFITKFFSFVIFSEDTPKFKGL